jgi:hypothetical protein
VQGVVDGLLPVAAVGGDGPGTPAGAFDDPLDRGGELGAVGRVALLQDVVEDDSVVVVGDLALVAELDRLAEDDGKVKRVFVGLAGPLGPELDGLKGLLAGFGTALGFLVPPRSRTRATARARLYHEPVPTRNDHDCGQRPVSAGNRSSPDVLGSLSG